MCVCVFDRAWVKGVGYGHGLSSAEVWNSKKAEAAQAAQDADIQRIFLQLEADLQALLAEGGLHLCWTAVVIQCISRTRLPPSARVCCLLSCCA